MAPESCNLGKDDAELLKPSSPTTTSSSSSSSSSSSAAAASTSSPPPSSPSPSSTSLLLPPQQPSCFLLEPHHSFQSQSSGRPETAVAAVTLASSLPKPDEEPPRPPAPSVIRCSTCHKRIGITGFRCRCGDLFCARHRYSDTHDCSYDYKAAGREEISKANPVIRAAKILKI